MVSGISAGEAVSPGPKEKGKGKLIASGAAALLLIGLTKP